MFYDTRKIELAVAVDDRRYELPMQVMLANYRTNYVDPLILKTTKIL